MHRASLSTACIPSVTVFVVLCVMCAFQNVFLAPDTFMHTAQRSITYRKTRTKKIELTKTPHKSIEHAS